ncbi:hypothetical protein F4808DRAFT_283246 [Astrocystis sublimbata]|nr:hypothetical protein F4808DRAFT_283246 [Astrocystis sublimbata]
MAPQDPSVSTDSNGGGLLITAIVTLTIAWLSVALRTYVRTAVTKSFQVDDWVMLAGLANFTVSCAFNFAALYNGLGRHNKSLSQEDEIEALKWQALATASYVLNMWLIKLSIGLFLLRLAVQKVYKWILWVSIIIVGIWTLALFFWNIFQCYPVEAQWDYTILESDSSSRCVSPDEIVNAAYALSALTVLSDWLYALLPIPMIWNAKMTAQAKWSVIAVLSLGVFASVATLVRLVFLADITDLADILHAATNTMIWTLIEPGIAISAASLATIRPLLRRWKIRGFTHSERSHVNTTGWSHTQGSRARKPGKMPGFGPQDVTMIDLESARPPYTAESQTPITALPALKVATHLPKYSDDEYSPQDEAPTWPFPNTANPVSGAPRSEVSSGLLFVGGVQSTQSLAEPHVNGGAWLDGESPNSSMEFHKPRVPSHSGRPF